MDYTKWDSGVELYAEIIKTHPSVASVTTIFPTVSPYTGSEEAIAVIVSTDKELTEFNKEAMMRILEIANERGALCSISIFNNKPAVYLY